MSKGSTFDLIVHNRDAKSGRILSVNPYKLVCDKEKGNYYIRDGLKYHLNGELMADQDKKKPAPKEA